MVPSDAHELYDALGADDKQLEFVPGAHYFENDEADRERVADLIRAWVEQR